MDIQGLSANQVSASMQSFASDLQAVDLPVFEDSQNAGPGSPNDLALGMCLMHYVTRNIP